MLNVINGVDHVENTMDFQAFMFMPIGAQTLNQPCQIASECFHALQKILSEKKFDTNKGDEENNIKFFQPIKILDIQSEIIDAKPDLILTCAYGQFINTKILEVPKYKCINIHASLLPKYRGGAPIH